MVPADVSCTMSGSCKEKRHAADNALAVLLSLALFFAGCTKCKEDGIRFIYTEKMRNCGYGLLFFFSSQSCPSCMDVAEELSFLAKGIAILGVIDKRDESALEELRKRYLFPICLMDDGLKPYRPILSPSIVAVDRKGRILMILPGLSGQGDYIQRILWELSAKSMNMNE